MFDSLQLAAIGSAAVLDAVLLIALLEKPNRRRVALWMLWMTGATFLFHAGSFFHHLLARAGTPWALALDRAAMLTMASGLLLLPAAMLHGGLRLATSGVQMRPTRDWRFALPYGTLLALLPIAAAIRPETSREFLSLLQPFRTVYVVWFVAVSITASACYLQLRSRPEAAAHRGFLTALPVILIVSAILIAAGALYGVDAWPQAADAIALGLTLLPLATVILFIYYVMRFGLLQLLLERSLVYGAIVLAFLLVHQLVIADVRDALSEQFRINFAILEGIAAAALILLYAPFRQRVAEGLRYLGGTRADVTRARARELSAHITAATGQPTTRFIASVSDEIRDVFDLSGVAIALSGPQPTQAGLSREGGSLHAGELAGLIKDRGLRYVSAWDSDHPRTIWLLDELDFTAAVLIEHGDVFGIMLLGTRSGQQRVGEEEFNAIILLAEQLGVTLQLEHLQAQRIATERRVMQQEKLSTLGLLAGSIAHEVRNPLSSIKAITTVMAEDLGSDSEHAEDLQLVLSEIDRLSKTTSQLLAFARSEPHEFADVRPAEVLGQTLQLLSHIAKRENIRITADLNAGEETVSADVTALREIYFNLLTNSLDAAGSGGSIVVTCTRENGHVVTRVRDDGPGIAAEIQDRLFEPFATTKADGTGLGLYIVGRHVRELGGEIHCETTAGAGTEFTLKLPCGEST